MEYFYKLPYDNIHISNIFCFFLVHFTINTLIQLMNKLLIFYSYYYI